MEMTSSCNWDTEENSKSVSLDDVGVVAKQSIRVKSRMFVFTLQLSFRPDSPFLRFFSKSLLNLRMKQNAHDTNLPELEIVEPTHSKKPRKRSRGMSLDNYIHWGVHGIRPGLSVRIIRAEFKYAVPGVAEYVLQVTDLHTKVFWTVKKRFSDFFQLRKEIRQCIRQSNAETATKAKYLFDLPFPRRRVRTANSDVILRRRVVLEQYLRNVGAIEPVDTIHIRILSLFQRFLCSSEFIDSLEKIDTSKEPNDIKWLGYDLFKMLNNGFTIEGQTCEKYISAFRNRCAVTQAALNIQDTSIAQEALNDLRHAITKIEKYVYDHLDQRYFLDIVSNCEEGVDVSEKVEKIVCHAVEDTLVIPLREQLHYLVNSTINIEEEKQLAKQIEKLSGKSQSFFGISSHLQSEDNFGRSRHLLKALDEHLLPSEMLQDLIASANSIFQSCGDEMGIQSFENSSALTADDYLPIHIYVVVHSGLKRPLLIKELLGAMIHPAKMMNEVGYFLTMFEVALKYIHDFDIEAQEQEQHCKK